MVVIKVKVFGVVMIFVEVVIKILIQYEGYFFIVVVVVVLVVVGDSDGGER